MKLEYFTTPKDGIIGKKVGGEIRHQLKSLEGKRVKITVEKVKKSRSLAQNAYMHLMFTIFKDALNDLGNEFNMPQVKEMLKLKFLKTEVVNEDTGETIGERVRHTSELTTTELNVFIEDVIRYGAEEFNVTIPFPNEQLTID